MASILDDPKLLEDVYTQVQDASGSATEELNKYLESIDGHLQKFQNTWQQVWDTTLNSDVIKFFVDLGTGTGEVVNKIGGLTPVVIGLASAFASLSKNVGMRKMLSIIQYADYYMCSSGYRSFHIMLCEIHRDKLGLYGPNGLANRRHWEDDIRTLLSY